MSNEIIIYQPDIELEKIEVRIDNETVWLNRHQISTLFDRDIKTIGKHINNALKEELEGSPTVANFATVQKEGNRLVERNIEHYNLDVIISVGYRVKSKRGVQFRMWANRVLKDHLLKGYSINNRFNRIEDRMDALSKKVEEIDFEIHTSLQPKQGIFFDGQVFDAYAFVSEIVKQAKKTIILIDNYIDESVLTLLSKKDKKVNVIIYTQPNKSLDLDVKKYNQQYEKIEIKTLSKSHDRFIIIDQKTLYHFGASLKDLGKKWFAFSKMETDASIILHQLDNEKKD
jgi:hypothetical protein